MNLWLRLIAVVFAGLRAKRSDPLAVHTIKVRIWPSDLDLNGHVNNGRFLSLLDLGRADLVARCGVLKTARLSGIGAVVAAATIRYRRSLKVGERVQLSSRLLGWDARSFFVAQKIENRGEIVAIALVRLRTIGPSGALSSEDTIRTLNLPAASPTMPPVVATWGEVENGLEAAWNWAISPGNEANGAGRTAVTASVV